MNWRRKTRSFFGFFVEYLYRDRSILSREVQNCSEYETLALLYAMGEHLQTPKFKAYSFWRFVQRLYSTTVVPDVIVCNLLSIVCTKITEREPQRIL